MSNVFNESLYKKRVGEIIMKLKLACITAKFTRRDIDGKWYCWYSKFQEHNCGHTEDTLVDIAKHYTEKHLQDEINSPRPILETEYKMEDLS